jgi:hypothetical protein
VGKYIALIGHDDTPHLKPPVISDESREALLADLLPHERRARETGRPALGAGAIYPLDEDTFLIDPFKIPEHWLMGYALDPGWNVTAALLGAQDPDTQQIYLTGEFYGQRNQPVVHAYGIKAMLPWPTLEGCIDPADNVGSQKDGAKLKQEYEDLSLRLMNANNAVHAGLRHVLVLFETGQLKVFRTLTYFMTEFRLYRRDEKGKIVKTRDHLMDCMRYLLNTDGAFQARPIERGRSRSRGEW